MTSGERVADWASWLEAWISGYRAHACGVPNDAEELMRAANKAWQESGGELARKVNEGVISEEDARALLGGRS